MLGGLNSSCSGSFPTAHGNTGGIVHSTVPSLVLMKGDLGRPYCGPRSARPLPDQTVCVRSSAVSKARCRFVPSGTTMLRVLCGIGAMRNGWSGGS